VINEVKVSPKNPTHLYILFVFSSFIIKWIIFWLENIHVGQDIQL
jgi:hypothetical protein